MQSRYYWTPCPIQRKRSRRCGYGQAKTQSGLPAWYRHSRLGETRIYTRAPKESLANEAWEIAILAPRTNKATHVARMALRSGRPIRILMPTELVYFSAQNNDGSFDEHITEAIKAATKLTIMASNMTWLCVGSGIERNDVFINLTKTKPPGPHDKWSAGVGYLKD